MASGVFFIVLWKSIHGFLREGNLGVGVWEDGLRVIQGMGAPGETPRGRGLEHSIVPEPFLPQFVLFPRFAS